MYKITIHHPQQGQAAIKFETESRLVARSAKLVGQGAKIKVDVVLEQQPKPVKFRGIDDDA